MDDCYCVGNLVQMELILLLKHDKIQCTIRLNHFQAKQKCDNQNRREHQDNALQMYVYFVLILTYITILHSSKEKKKSIYN